MIRDPFLGVEPPELSLHEHLQALMNLKPEEKKNLPRVEEIEKDWSAFAD